MRTPANWFKHAFRSKVQSEGEESMAAKSAQNEDESGEDRAAARAKRQAARSARASGSERPLVLCTLRTLEVKKGEDGIQLILHISDGRRVVRFTAAEVAGVLRDLETAIHVIRGQQ